MTTAKIVTIDIETSPIYIRHKTYDLSVKTKRFNPDEIIQDWVILGAAWKPLNGKTSCISVSSKNVLDDYAVVQKLHDVISEHDIIVGHNSDNFDLKKFNARAIYHGLPPIGQKCTVDTLKVARRTFRMTSNKLAYVASYLGVGAKDEAPDWDLIMQGDVEELAKMRAYNKQDVDITEKVYLKLLGYMPNHPNLNLWPDIDVSGHIVSRRDCPKCGGHHVVSSGYKTTKAGKYKQYQCKSCGGFHSDKSTMIKLEVK